MTLEDSVLKMYDDGENSHEEFCSKRVWNGRKPQFYKSLSSIQALFTKEIFLEPAPNITCLAASLGRTIESCGTITDGGTIILHLLFSLFSPTWILRIILRVCFTQIFLKILCYLRMYHFRSYTSFEHLPRQFLKIFLTLPERLRR